MDFLTLSASTLYFPFTYLIGDIVTEIYGYRAALLFIWAGLALELVFAVFCLLTIHITSANLTAHSHYYIIYRPMLLFVTGGVISNLASSFLNVFIISKFKVLYQGKLFWARSITGTAISELFMLTIIFFVSFLPQMNNLYNFFMVLLDTYIMELFYAVIFVWVGQYLVNTIKQKTGIDHYDTNISYNPFNINWTLP
ncbi:queuosine precursor transporter [Facilibium subflavum]|uniref:queuosine precursor transporter n=1 Tax=Facilibium subflavum TaxID=2219058 RepID=UPI0022872428|nr:queuosine precursor transporter [Facilibium subflavum]